MFRQTLLFISSLFLLASPSVAQELLIQRASTNRMSPQPLRAVVPGSKSSGTFSTRSSKGERLTVERVTLPSGADLDKAVEAYKNEPGVVSVEVNQKFRTLDVSNDPLYTNGSLWGMYSSDSPPAGPSGTTNAFGSQAEQAWSLGNVGSMRTVVGVIDTGIDYTHPDLYLNIYLNQGEIPASFRSQLTDSDGDGVITFRDLNNVSNAPFVSDLNNNGRVDAGDLLLDSRWSNSVDEDSSGYTDDLIGWDFVNGDNDPMDDHYHGTHVAGTIGGIGGNSTGVAGANWKVQLMPLKFLGSGGSGYLSDAILAIDYFTAATFSQDKAYKAGSPLLFLGTNNSWGGGGYSSLLRTSIVNGALRNNHFVAAAGNESSNNDSSFNYPANFTTLPEGGWEAVTAVASLNSNGTLSYFSNYGKQTVDLGAPGAGIQSAAPGGSYQALSGTSMATPHVTGALALYASAFPSAARSSYRSTLLENTTSTTSLSNKTVTNGRLNVARMFNPVATTYIWGTITNNVLTGTSGPNYVTGVPSTGITPAQLGKGQIDTVTGGSDSDVFLLGQFRSSFARVFYNNGIPSSNGTNDYLLITDLNTSEDKIAFVPGRYFTRFVSPNTQIYWDRNNNGSLSLTGTSRDELIGVVQGVNLGNVTLTSTNFPSWAMFLTR